jgi:hypothetical protein
MSLENLAKTNELASILLIRSTQGSIPAALNLKGG